MRRTLAESISFSSVGIHTGELCAIRLHPSHNSGIIFLRNGITIPATFRYKSDDRRSTALSHDGVSVMTVEHLLATFYAYAVDDCIVEITSGSEIPIGDGSAAMFCALLNTAGIAQTEGMPDIFVIQRPFSYEKDSVKISVEPRDITSIDFTYDGAKFGFPVQRTQIDITQVNFERDIAPARTFGFWEEIEYLRKNGLAVGGSFDNALVIKDGLPYNTEYRMPDEPVKHKILDLIGDLSLAGKRFVGAFTAERSGHYHNGRFVQCLYETMIKE